MKHDFIFDVETIGQNALVCPVIDIAYIAFNWDKFLTDPYSFEELTQSVQTSKLDVREQLEKYNCKYKQHDLNFWRQQPVEVRNKINPSKNDLTVSETFDKLIQYLNGYKIGHWWTRSNTFDPVILWRLAREEGRWALLDEHLKYYRVRDIRTFIDAKFDFKTKNGFVPVADVEHWEKTFSAHDSTHDVAADVLRLQAIHRAENDLEQVEK